MTSSLPPATEKNEKEEDKLEVIIPSVLGPIAIVCVVVAIVYVAFKNRIRTPRAEEATRRPRDQLNAEPEVHVIDNYENVINSLYAADFGQQLQSSVV